MNIGNYKKFMPLPLFVHKRIALHLNINNFMSEEKIIVKFSISPFLYVKQNKQFFPDIPRFPGKFEIRETGSREICVREYVKP